MGLEESVLLVPEFGVYLFTKVGSLLEINAGLADGIGKHTDVANSHCIAVHVGIDAGTQVLLFASATDGFLHCILYVGLPIEASFTGMGSLPIVVFPFQRWQHRDYPVLTTIY